MHISTQGVNKIMHFFTQGYQYNHTYLYSHVSMKPYTSLLRGVNETIDISTQGCQWNHIHLYSGVSMEPYIFLLRGVNETIHVSTQECQWKHTYLYSGVTMKPYTSLLRSVNETIHYSGVSMEPYLSLLRGVNGTIRIYSFTLTINDRKQISTDNTSLVSKILSVHCHIETMKYVRWLSYWNHEICPFIMILKPCSN